MKKFLKIFIIILGVLVMMTNLFGCDKNSRAHVESQFVDLEKIYSAANVSDLFKFYPKGFEIIYTVSNFDETGKDVQYSINVSGNPIDKSIKGFIEKKTGHFFEEDITSEIAYKHNIQYSAQGWESLDSDYVMEKEAKNITFLFQSNVFSEKILAGYKLINSRYNPEIPAYHLSYYLDEELAKKNHLDSSWRNQNENFVLSFTRNISDDRKYVQVNMSTSRSLKSETIINEYREVNDNE